MALVSEETYLAASTRHRELQRERERERWLLNGCLPDVGKTCGTFLWCKDEDEEEEPTVVNGNGNGYELLYNPTARAEPP